jgi:hypothetical protein
MVSLQQRLQKNVQGYLARPAIGRAGLKMTINEISENLPNTVIFGGMIRDFALGIARKFSSDIDFVSMSSRDSIFKAISHHSPTMNKFGGFRFVIGKQQFDIWSFSDTWAFREGHALGENFSDLLKTTFFNLDAAYYHLSETKITFASDYEKFIEERLLDINLAPNPRPSSIAHRALSLALTRQLGITRALAFFILENINLSDLTWAETVWINNLRLFLTSNKTEAFRFLPQRELAS